MTTNSDFRDIMQLGLLAWYDHWVEFCSGRWCADMSLLTSSSFLCFLLSNLFSLLPSFLFLTSISFLFLFSPLQLFLSSLSLLASPLSPHLPFLSLLLPFPNFLPSSHPFLTSIMLFGLFPQPANPTPFPTKAFFPLFLDFSRAFPAVIT